MNRGERLHAILIDALNNPPDPNATPLTVGKFIEMRRKLHEVVYVRKITDEAQERDN